MLDENIDFNLVNKISHDLIIKHLCQNECQKNIIMSPDLPRIIDGIVKYGELKEHGLSKIFFLEENMVRTQADKSMEWIYIVRPDINNLRIICKQINSDIKMSSVSKYPYKILFAPRKLYACDLIFEREGLFEYVQMDELENDLIQLDSDLLSMEFPRFFSNYFLFGDQSWFPSIAKSLINIQEWFGIIPNVHLHGNCAKSIYELVEKLESLENNIRNRIDYKIGHLVLIDRNVDFITPLCSPLIFEGLLDESFNINAGFVDLPEAENKKKRVKLDNEDKIFEEIRGMHISEVFGYLKNKVHYLNSLKDKKNELNSTSELKEYIKGDLKDFTKAKESVSLYLSMSEIILSQKTHLELQNYLTAEHVILTAKEYKKSFEYIEELINRNYDMNQVIRLMILLSKTNDGLSSSDHTQLTNQFLQNYGYEKIFLLQNLQRVGLFETSDSNAATDQKFSRIEVGSKSFVQTLTNRLKFSNNYSSIIKKLGIIPSNELSQNEIKSDLSYAFNGQYRPILCKYITKMLFPENNKANFEEISKLFPGEYELKSRGTSQLIRAHSNNNASSNKTVLIFFLGGCSYAEIAVLKKIAQQKGFKFLFATTSFLNADSVINLFQ